MIGAWIINWESLVAIVSALLVVGALAALAMIRDPRSHRLRIGVFFERDNNRSAPPPEEEMMEEEPAPYWPSSEDTVELPPGETRKS